MSTHTLHPPHPRARKNTETTRRPSGACAREEARGKESIIAQSHETIPVLVFSTVAKGCFEAHRQKFTDFFPQVLIRSSAVITDNMCTNTAAARMDVS